MLWIILLLITFASICIVEMRASKRKHLNDVRILAAMTRNKKLKEAHVKTKQKTA